MPTSTAWCTTTSSGCRAPSAAPGSGRTTSRDPPATATVTWAGRHWMRCARASPRLGLLGQQLFVSVNDCCSRSAVIWWWRPAQQYTLGRGLALQAAAAQVLAVKPETAYVAAMVCGSECCPLVGGQACALLVRSAALGQGWPQAIAGQLLHGTPRLDAHCPPTQPAGEHPTSFICSRGAQ